MSPNPCGKCGFLRDEPGQEETRLARCPVCGDTGEFRPPDPFSSVVDSLEFDIASRKETHDAIPSRIGRFEIRKRIGKGGFGIIYLAYDPSLDREVALKVSRQDRLSSDALQLLLIEAQTAARLRHPHIVAVHEVDQAGGSVHIVTDYIEGETLAARLKKGLPDRETAVRWCIQLAGALDHAHSREVIHRDLKPANIMLDANDDPLITDFGLARRQVVSSSGSGPSNEDRYAGSQAGTPGYMSPEQAASMSQEARAASDVYSLGVTLFEMLTGRRPFIGSSPEVLRATILADPPSPRKFDRSIPRELEAVCLKCLEKAPEKRYTSARDLAQDLEKFLAGTLRTGGIPSSARYQIRKAYRHRIPLATGIVLTCLLAIGIWQLLEWVAWRKTLCPILLQTIPPGARVVLIPIDEQTGLPRLADAIQPAVAERYLLTIPEGFYLIEANIPGGGVQEVFRTVTRAPTKWLNEENGPLSGYRALCAAGQESDGRIVLPPIAIAGHQPDSRWIEFAGGTFMTGSDILQSFPMREVEVLPFLLQAREVSVAEYWSVMKSLPVLMERGGDRIEPDSTMPVSNVGFWEAVEFSEQIGARLPALDEYLFAATNGGTTRFPWGDIWPEGPAAESWNCAALEPPDFDKSRSSPPLEGLYSRVAEWTHTVPPAQILSGTPNLDKSALPANARFVAGAPPSVITGRPNPAEFSLGPRMFGIVLAGVDPGKGVGFRCAVSRVPRYLDPIETIGD